MEKPKVPLSSQEPFRFMCVSGCSLSPMAVAMAPTQDTASGRSLEDTKVNIFLMAVLKPLSKLDHFHTPSSGLCASRSDIRVDQSNKSRTDHTQLVTLRSKKANGLSTLKPERASADEASNFVALSLRCGKDARASQIPTY